MSTVQVPLVTQVKLLPNLFLAVSYQDGQVKYVRSQINPAEQSVLPKGWPKHLGGSPLTPSYYWLGSQIELNTDNTFSVNGQLYDGCQIYQVGRRTL